MKNGVWQKSFGEFLASAGLMVALFGVKAFGQPAPTPLANFWRPDAPVHALAAQNGSLYLGGAFGYVGPLSGPLGAARVDSGAITLQVPSLSGVVYAVAHDAAGNRYFGGDFVYTPEMLTNLIKVFPSGIVDSRFRPNPNDPVRALAYGGQDTLYVGGEFARIADSNRRFLTGLDARSGAVNAWAPTSQGQVFAITVVGELVYLGGRFSTLGGQPRARLASAHALTGVVTDWNPGVSGGSAEIRAIVAVDDLVYVGGVFTTCGGKPRNRLAALDSAGVATAWNPNVVGDGVNALVEHGGALAVGGSFTSIGSLTRTNLAMVDLSTGLAIPGFAATPNGIVTAMIGAEDDLIVGGRFSLVNGEQRRGLARLEGASGAVRDWEVRISSLNLATTAAVLALAKMNQELLVGGDFLSVGGALRSRLAALDVATGAATDWNPGADRDVHALATSPTAIYVGGLFTNVAGEARSRLAAVSPAGALLPFNPGVTASAANGILSLALTGTRLYVGGNFTAIGSSNRNSLALLHLPEGLIDQWGPALSGGAVRTILPTPASIFVGGDFTSIAGANRRSLASLSISGRGTNLPAFVADPNGRVHTLHLRENDLFVGGEFSNIGGQARNRLARLDAATGAAAATWDPAIVGSGQTRISALLELGPVLYLGGTFTAAGGEFRNRLASLTRDTALATSWNPDADQAVSALAIAGGRFFIAGSFTIVGTRFTPYLAAFDSSPHLLAHTVEHHPSGAFQFDITTGDGGGTSVRVEATAALSNPVWQPIASFPVTGSTATVEDPDAGTQAPRYYRAVLE